MRKLAALTLSVAMWFGSGTVIAGDKPIELGGLTSKVPAGWTMQKPSNNLRMYQMSVAKSAGDKENAELAIFKNFGGSTEDNIARWKKQFIAPEGKTIDEVSKLEKYKVGTVADVVCLDITGTFKYKNPPLDPRAKEERKDNFRRFNLIFDTDKDTYFITLTGPAATMQQHKAGFDNWIKGFK